MANISWRNSKIVYYGPNECLNCGTAIAKMGAEWGSNAFTYPKGPIYPNTEWHPHVCDPVRVYHWSQVRPSDGISRTCINGDIYDMENDYPTPE